ncbi:hypothetical protein QMK17_00550 [Rhodococcus sp. G-MC3]|uniref:hypothetical protein n=1 Tax=Rhodococcus sp. G-MC3 TaxID=3046209 RepID=UPI0024BBAEA7|nr:hypothetical protein [Rhodococcus sp. G-MC3]MDJ0391818.1 hypothetical protein [Rhodococcus sp. G-MC3]
MRDYVSDRFPHGDGLSDDVLTEFGVSRQGFVGRLREILLQNPPPEGLDEADVAHLLAVCS